MPRNEHLSDQRKRLVARLRDEDAEDLIGKLEECGSPVGMVCTDCGHHRKTFMHCKRRWCPECQPMVSAKRHERWGNAVAKIQWPLFLTLTIPNTKNADGMKIAKKAWSKMRRRKVFADRVKGGVAAFEVTNKGNGWHPHIHAICDCKWLAQISPAPRKSDSQTEKARLTAQAQLEVSALWADCLGVPKAMIYLKRATRKETISAEILKYCLKGSELIECVDPIAPLLRALKSTRTLAGWGTLFPLPQIDEEEKCSVECESCSATKSYVPEEVAAYMSRLDQPQSWQPPDAADEIPF
jgi:hypothetical protein